MHRYRGPAADAGVNLACDRIVEEMSESIDALSLSIIESFDSMTKESELIKDSMLYLQSQDPEKADKYLHQKFTHVMQQKTFLEIWDNIEGKLQTGADILTTGHGNAAKHVKMVNKKLGGSKGIAALGYVSRFAPLATE